MARRAGDDAALAYALDARCIAVIGPETREQFGETVAEVRRIAEAAGDSDRFLQSHLYRMIHLFQLGDMPAGLRDLATVTRLAEESREPGFQYYAAAVDAAVALFEGRFESAPELIRHGYAFGRRATTFTAVASYLLQMFVLHREQGAPPYEENELREFAAQQPSYTILRCALAAFLTGDGRTAEATMLFEELAADDFSHLYVDEEWLASATLLTEVCWSLGDIGARPLSISAALAVPDAECGRLAGDHLGICGTAPRHPRGDARQQRRLRGPLQARARDEHPHGSAPMGRPHPARLRAHADPPRCSRRSAPRPAAPGCDPGGLSRPGHEAVGGAGGGGTGSEPIGFRAA